MKITVGRHNSNDIVINDTSVSRFHAELVNENNQWYIIDLNSTNGTFVNGIKIQGKIPVSIYDEIKLGNVSVNLEKIINKKKGKPIKIITIGRANTNNVVITDPLISAKHAKITIYDNGDIEIQDLNSTNGSFVNGKRIQAHILKDYDDVLLANKIPLDWKKFVNKPQTYSSQTGQYKKEEIKHKKKNAFAPLAIVILFIIGFAFTFWILKNSIKNTPEKEVINNSQQNNTPSKKDTIIQKIIVRGSDECIPPAEVHSAPQIKTPGHFEGKISKKCYSSKHFKDLLTALKYADYNSKTVRNKAVCWASAYEGPINIGQITAIYDSLRKYWRYVNDPKNNDYYAKASETIKNAHFIGDCDDFAILLYSMIYAIGGAPRLSFAYDEQGGHAFVEVYIGSKKEPQQLKQIHEFLFQKYQMPKIHFRTYKDQIWLNLDWFSEYPGGKYFNYNECYTADPLNGICLKEVK